MEQTEPLKKKAEPVTPWFTGDSQQTVELVKALLSQHLKTSEWKEVYCGLFLLLPCFKIGGSDKSQRTSKEKRRPNLGLQQKYLLNMETPKIITLC